MLAIRLQRIGRKKSPSYRLVISENARDTQGRALEILGHYNPVANPKIVELKVDRIKHWLGLGAQSSESVHNLLVREGVVTEGGKKKSVTISKKRQGKIDVKKTAAEEAKKAALEAAKEAEAKAAEDAKAAAEAEAAAKAEADQPEADQPAAGAEAPKEEAPAESTEAKSEGGEEEKAAE